nr:histone deacetylase complex subunit SAP18-like [Penaeus vannamei]
MASTVESKVEERKDTNEKPIDREKTCPLLLRVFCSNGRHNSLAEYRRGNTPPNELQIYTWMDATLREIDRMQLYAKLPLPQHQYFPFVFHISYSEAVTLAEHQMTAKLCSAPVNEGLIQVRQNCHFIVQRVKVPSDDHAICRPLLCRFIIGDYLDIAITPPSRGPPQRRMLRPY